ncbi:MAG: hypothetical protein ABI361_04295 [Nitrososphaera sp.]|jgi:Na+-translocating ferredoxin:NAD+ oxidoreductase RnfD subunit
MSYTGVTNPNSPVSMALKLIAGGAFLVLGVLFIFDPGRAAEGAVLAAAACGWLFFILRNYSKHRADLESLR